MMYYKFRTKASKKAYAKWTFFYLVTPFTTCDIQYIPKRKLENKKFNEKAQTL